MGLSSNRRKCNYNSVNTDYTDNCRIITDTSKGNYNCFFVVVPPKIYPVVVRPVSAKIRVSAVVVAPLSYLSRAHLSSSTCTGFV